MKLKEVIVNNKEIFQLIYGVFLIILIPFLIAVNTTFVVSKYRELINVSLQRRALTVGNSLVVAFADDIDNKERLQSKMKNLSVNNIDVVDLQILIPDGSRFKVIAAKKDEDINKSYTSPYYQFAWTLLNGDGVATNSVHLSEKNSDLMEGFSISDRLWLVSVPIYQDDESKALLSLKLSSEVIDEMLKGNETFSFILVTITILSVILFLSLSVRIWDYALLYRRIKEVDKMKDDFISIASHELRTPLTAIKGYVSMMGEGDYGKVTKKMKDGLSNIMLSVNRLNNLVEDLLNVSRIEQGRLKVENKPTKLKPIIKEIIVSLKPSADKKKLKLICKNPSQAVPMVDADPDRLRQVLINLIGNAIKYTKKGRVEILAEIYKDNKVKIIVSDTGFGMNKEEQSHLFEKFYRVKNDRTNKIVGTGLGLWITKQLIELMGGKIDVESMSGVGTRISFYLDISKK
jgi:signal transduction histidine kinase